MDNASSKLVASMWDDGLASDLRLIEILSKYDLTSCFAISPGRHQNFRVLNDSRGDYGELVTLKELSYFEKFEICNHTLNHVNLINESKENVFNEIMYGQLMLEDIFGRLINGFCYPYGEYNQIAIDCLKNLNYQYARTTRYNGIDNLTLPVTCRWNDPNLFNYFEHNKKTIFWGHTYEFKNENDWAKIEEIYKYLYEHNFKVLKFKEIVNV